MTATTAAELGRRIAALVEPAVAAADVELVDVEVRGARGSHVVRVVADADEGLDIDRIARLSQRIGELLDTEDVFDASYTLEVSSPGADRPLRGWRDFRRNVGREVRVTRNQQRPDGAPGEVVGTVVAADATGVELELDGTSLVLSLDEIEHGKVVLPW